MALVNEAINLNTKHLSFFIKLKLFRNIFILNVLSFVFAVKVNFIEFS